MVLGFSQMRKSAAINGAEREGGGEAGGDDFDLGVTFYFSCE